MAHCYSRIFALSFVALLACASAPSAAQSPALVEMSKKSQLTDADKATLADEVQKLAVTLSKATVEKPAEEAREAILLSIAIGTPTYRAEAARVVAERVDPLIRGDGLVSLNAAITLNRLQQVSTLPTLINGVSSTGAGVRYQCAIAIRALHSQITTAGDYKAAIGALADQAERETDSAVLRALYLAIDFKLSNKDFAGVDDIAIALTRILAARSSRHGTMKAHPINDLAGFQAALRIAGDLKNPPTQLVAMLALNLKTLVTMYTQDPTSAPAYLVADCEAALRVAVEKHGTSLADAPRISDMIGNQASAADVKSALAKYIGVDETPGALNNAPWSLPIDMQ